MATKLVKFFKTFFLVAALYDLILGAVFFLLYGPVYDFLDIALPNSTSYIHLMAGFVFVQGIGYWFVYRNMLRNIDLVRLGVIYKAVYSSVAVYYLAIGQLPDAIFAWFAIFDVLFLIGFVRFLMLARTSELDPVPQG
ncbi:MAG: hypothetical protein O7F70_05545 [Gemmatimonadetes bacterium]|nr:hypothetical protein [Gemmatimonadota bacterium]